MDNLLDVLVGKAMTSILDASEESEKIKDKSNKTQILNAEYHMAQFHAYLDIIEILDFEKMVLIADETRDMVDKVLRKINLLYL